MVTRSEVESFYENELKSRIAPLEAERKKLAGRIVLLSIISGSIVAGCVVLFVAVLGDASPWLAFLAMALLISAIGGWTFFHNRLKAGYVGRFKNVVIQGLIHRIDPSFIYEPDACIPLKEYRKSGIFREGVDRYSGDDLVRGTIGETPFHFSEVHSEYKTESTDSKGNRTTHWHTIFWGLMFRALFAKSFHGRTYVLNDRGAGKRGFFKALNHFFQKMDKSHGQLVKMDNPDFEELFVVYSDDSIEAHYILSQSMMERLTNYARKTGRGTAFSFVENTVFAAIPFNRPLLEPKIFRTLYDKETILGYYDDLALAISIVEELNLNTRLWGDVASPI